MSLSLEPSVLNSSNPVPVALEGIKQDETRDICTLDAMLAMETVAKRGELTGRESGGTILFITNVCPRVLETTVPSRVSYISRLFLQWRGEIEFNIYTTRSIYQQVKLLAVFVPGYTPDQVRSTPVEQLMAYQNRLVFSAESDQVRNFRVPFISLCPWLSTSQSTGTFALVLLEPIVTSLETMSKIPWIVTVRAPQTRDGLSFRYSVPPSLPLTGGAGEGVPGEVPVGPGDADPQQVAMAAIGRNYATSCTRVKRGKSLGANLYSSSSFFGASGSVGAPCELKHLVPVRVAGIDAAALARRLCQFEIVPPASFVQNSIASRKSIVPFLPSIVVNGPLANVDHHTWWWSNSNNSVEGGGHVVFFGQNSGYFNFRVLLPDVIVQEFDGWKVCAVFHSSQGTKMARFTCKRESPGQLFLDIDNGAEIWGTGGIGIEVGSPITWVDDPQQYSSGTVTNRWPALLPWLTTHLQRVQSLSATDYIAIYVQGDATSRGAVFNYLNSSTDPVAGSNYPPQAATGCRISFSVSQSPWLFDMEYMAAPSSRGIFTWIFNVFNGDPKSPWAKIARIADIVFDLFVPLVLTYDGSPTASTLENGWTLEFEQVAVGVPKLQHYPVFLAEPPTLDTTELRALLPPSAPMEVREGGDGEDYEHGRACKAAHKIAAKLRAS